MRTALSVKQREPSPEENIKEMPCPGYHLFAAEDDAGSSVQTGLVKEA